ncbi:hypothetical protein TNCV_345331 [Trichonephila clavipes]|nr:hypothetical protein TNCV_345331 [Trichonephila clavipes]
MFNIDQHLLMLEEKQSSFFSTKENVIEMYMHKIFKNLYEEQIVAANRELTHLHSPTNRSAPYPLLKSRTITQDFFPPKPDGVSAHDDDVTLLPCLVLQSPCHYRKSQSGNTFLQSGLSTSIRNKYTFVRGRRILLDPYPRDINRNRSKIVHLKKILRRPRTSELHDPSNHHERF